MKINVGYHSETDYKGVRLDSFTVVCLENIKFLIKHFDKMFMGMHSHSIKWKFNMHLLRYGSQ